MATTDIDQATVTVLDAPPAPPQRPRMVALATAFVAAGCGLYFAGLLGIYLLARSGIVSSGGTWVPDKVEIPLTQPNVMLFTLLLSSITIQWASDAIRNDDRANAYLALGLTLVFGVAFINMYAYLNTLLAFDTAGGAAMPVLYYLITGSHLVMLIGAMTFVGLMAFRALGGQFSSRYRDGLSASAMFWHAQVLVFCILWYAIYVVK